MLDLILKDIDINKTQNEINNISILESYLEEFEQEEDIDILASGLEILGVGEEFLIEQELNIYGLIKGLIPYNENNIEFINKIAKVSEYYISKVFQGDNGYIDSKLADARANTITKGSATKVFYSINISYKLVTEIVKLANNEINKIKEETDESIKSIEERLKNKRKSDIIKVSTLPFSDLEKLVIDIPKTVEKTQEAYDSWDFVSLLKKFFPGSVTKTVKGITKDTPKEELSSNTVEAMEKLEKNAMEKLYKKYKKDFYYLGYDVYKYEKGFIYLRGFHPPYKQKGNKDIKDVEQTFDLNKDKAKLIKLFETKEKNIVKLIEPITKMDDDFKKARDTLYNELDKIKKLWKDDKQAFFCSVKGCALVANRARFLSLLLHKHLKALKWISRKIRKIQTQIKI